MKRLLLLGGSAQQVIAIKRAKELGYHTILCDYLEYNPGKNEADEFYCVSTTDKDAVLDVAKETGADGIIAYSSDPAAPTAAYVAEKLNLPGIPLQTAMNFCNKNLFRYFLKENGFNVPRCVEFDKTETEDILDGFSFPVIVKPTDSSGSKGVTVIKDKAEFALARDNAASITRSGVLIAEEFIERDHPDVIEAEIFVINGKVIIWGLMNTIRDKYTNPLLPAGYSYPLNISERRITLVKDEINRLVKCSCVQHGAFNIEMIITEEEKLYFLDAGPRNGGNELPEFIGMIANGDIVEMTIQAAMGEFTLLPKVELDGSSNGYWGLYVLHSDRAGVFERVLYDEIASKHLIRETFFKKPGEYTGAFEISRDAIGLAYFNFEDADTRDAVMNDFTGKHIRIVMK